MTTPVAFVLFIVIVALIFDLANGWLDAANSIVTVVSTRCFHLVSQCSGPPLSISNSLVVLLVVQLAHKV